VKRILQRPLFRSLFAASFTVAALISDPRPAYALEDCYTACLWGCPSDKHFYCRVGGGSQCGFSATCATSSTCGALMTELRCQGFEE
jgi:hypothetical protein